VTSSPLTLFTSALLTAVNHHQRKGRSIVNKQLTGYMNHRGREAFSSKLGSCNSFVKFYFLNTNNEPGSSVSIVSVWLRTGRPGYQGSIPGRGKDFSSTLYVQTGSGAHPASCTMGTGGPFPGAKAQPGRDSDHSLPCSAEIKNE
jgi:hypothetical protein